MGRVLGAVVAGCAVVAVAAVGAAGAEDGRKIYEAKCVTCHGPDGKGLKEKVAKLFKKEIPDFTATDLSKLSAADRQKREQELRTKIEQPQPPMSSFVKTLTADEKAAVLEYVKQSFMNGGTK